MAKFGARILKGTTSATVGVASLEAPASGMRRIKLAEFKLGSDAASLGTSNFRFDFERSTTASTGTAVTPAPLDPADAACVALVKSNLTVEGTTAGVIADAIALSQQASFRWVANPGWEIVVPAVAAAGIIVKTPVCGNFPSFAGSLHFEEQ